MARPANAKFYDPEDANSKVALEARCDIMYTVLSNEPEVWRGFVKLISSLGQTLPFYTDWRRFDGIAMGVEFLAQWLDQRDYYIKSNEAAREFRNGPHPLDSTPLGLESIHEQGLGVNAPVGSGRPSRDGSFSKSR